jgi:hypothetical protein
VLRPGKLLSNTIDMPILRMVEIFGAVLTDALPAAKAARAEAITHGIDSADVVLNIVASRTACPNVPSLNKPKCRGSFLRPTAAEKTVD